MLGREWVPTRSHMKDESITGNVQAVPVAVGVTERYPATKRPGDHYTERMEVALTLLLWSVLVGLIIIELTADWRP